MLQNEVCRNIVSRATALTLAALVLTTLFAPFVSEYQETPDLLRDVSAAECRVLQARLAGFPHRGWMSGHCSASLMVRAAAAEFLFRPGSDAGRMGQALLLFGRAVDAVVRLRNAASTFDRPGDWNDLAAAEYEVFRGHGEAEAQALPRALAAVDRALLLEPRNAEARFNRALILTALQLDSAAVDAWRAFLKVDPFSPWALEATAQMRTLMRPARRDEWLKTLPRLEEAAMRNDSAFVAAVVRQFPQESRTWSEVYFLKEWADATSAGAALVAERRLQLAEMIGAALRDTTGEALLADAVIAVRHADRGELQSLVEAHRDYFAGRVQHKEGETAESLPLFVAAKDAFERAGSPMAYVAHYYRSIALYAGGHAHDALAIVSDLTERAPLRYRALHAQAHWQRGTILAGEGLLVEAADAQRQSLALFERLNESANLNLMRHNLAATEAALGHDAEAWRMRLATFRGLSDAGDPISLQSALEGAARTEALRGRWRETHSLMHVALLPEIRGNRRLFINSLIWSALAAHRLQHDAAAQRDLDAAHAMVEALPSSVRETVLNDLRFAEAIIIRRSDPDRTVRLLSEYVDTAARVGAPFLVPEALLERARGLRALGAHDDAIRDLRAALDGVDRRRKGADGLRDAYFTTGEAAGRELLDLLDARGADVEAFVTADRIRAGAIADRIRGAASPAVSIGALRETLAPGTLLVTYVVLSDRVVMFVVNSRELIAIRRAVCRDDLLADAANLIAVARGRLEELDGSDERLYASLVEPFESLLHSTRRLIVIPDPILSGLPYAALRNRRSGRFLVEDVAIVLAPSAGIYEDLQNGASSVRRDVQALIIGNPAIDRALFEDLEDLGHAAVEARTIGARYPRAKVLLDKNATKATMLEHLPQSNLLHLACHAVPVENDPAQSYLVLAPSARDSGALYLHEISALALPELQLVVLAGCRTAVPAAEVDTGSFALAFLVAGARTVIGTLSDVDDRNSAEFSANLHELLRSGVAPAESVRSIQLMLLRSPDSAHRRLQVWSVFQVIGSGD